MSTESQITANRLNAQKSTGPRTPEGKSVASQNAVKHGLTAESDVISSESQADFDIQSQEIIDELNPITPLEYLLAERIVSLSWRLKRAYRFQNRAFDTLMNPEPEEEPAHLKRFKAVYSELGLPPVEFDTPDEEPDPARIVVNDFSNDRVLDRLLMYERRIENSLYKTIREFQRLKLTGKPNTESETPADQSISFNPYTNAANINESILQNEPNLVPSEVEGSHFSNNNEQRTANYSKRTQFMVSKVEPPVLSEPVLSNVEVVEGSKPSLPADMSRRSFSEDGSLGEGGQTQF